MIDAASAPLDIRAGSDPVRAAVDRILVTDPAAANREELADVVASVARVRSWLDAYEIGCARRAEDLARAGRCESTESMFARSGQRSGKDAAKVADRNAVCESFESFEHALRDGRIAAGHLDGVGRQDHRHVPHPSGTRPDS